MFILLYHTLHYCVYFFSIAPKFKYTDYSSFKCSWWDYDIADDKTYIDDLKMIAQYHGYDKSMVDELIGEGFTLEEVEGFIYCGG